MTERIEDRLKRMIVERLFMSLSPDELDEEKSLLDEYDVDSVSLLELVVGIEEEFRIAIGDDDFDVDNFETVAKLANFVRLRLPGD